MHNMFFENIPHIEYEGPESKNPFSFKFYDPKRMINGKSMEEHLKFSVAYWHTLCGTGVDMFGSGTMDKTFGGIDPFDIAKRKVYAAFELMEKLHIHYFCFHDTDIVPTCDDLAETNKRLDIITELIEDQMKSTKKKLLWGTANLFSHPRYMHGAGTSCNADVFAYAAAQIKKALEITVRLGGTGYVFWGGREGYDTLLNTDIEFEQDNMARLLTLAVEYGRKIGFTGDFYIEPKPKEPCKHQYDYDAATAIAFLRKYDLIDEFKLNIEANHATLAGHTFQHELRMSRINDCFGSIDANQGDLLLGWDTDQFPSSVYESTMCMYEVLKAGGFKNGGLNFDAKSRRGSFTHEDIFYSLITGMDTFALGLIMAQKIIDDGRIDRFVSERYDSYQSGIGKKIVDNDITLEELEAATLAKDEIINESGSQEYLEGIINQIMFSKN